MNPLLLLEEAPVLAPVVGALVGVVLAMSPLAWPMAIATVATGVASSDDGRVPWRPVVAVGAGITAVYVVLGLAVGAIDALVRDVLGATAGVVLAVLAVLSIASGIVLVARPLAACRTGSADREAARGRRSRSGRCCRRSPARPVLAW